MNTVVKKYSHPCSAHATSPKGLGRNVPKRGLVETPEAKRLPSTPQESARMSRRIERRHHWQSVLYNDLQKGGGRAQSPAVSPEETLRFDQQKIVGNVSARASLQVCLLKINYTEF